MSNITTRIGGSVTTAQMPSENEQRFGDVSDEPFGDREALMQQFRDPRYQTSASFREMVAQEIARSSLMTQTPNSAQSGVVRHQHVGHPIDTPVPADWHSRELTEHEKAMIAKAEKAGL